MKLFDFGKDKLQLARESVGGVLDDTLPRSSHQVLVHDLAQEYLNCCERGKEKRRDEMDAVFTNCPLLGFEVMDEALVLYKNRVGGSRVADLWIVPVASQYEAFDEKVTALRDGRIRETTSPTLRGGGRRT